MKIIDVEPNSDAWLYARSGIVTASALSEIITPAFKPRTGETPETYRFKLLAERLRGAPNNEGGGASGWAAEQGQIEEREARAFFAATHGDLKISRVGFITTDDGNFGCSPDALLGDDGGLELKCPQPHTHLKYLAHGVLPPAYVAQVHGSLYVSGRAYWTFYSYSRIGPPLELIIHRDESIMRQIGDAVAEFNAKLEADYAHYRAQAREVDVRPLPPYRRFPALIF